MEQAKRVDIPYERKQGEVWAFMSLKFHDGDEDKEKVEKLTKALSEAGIKNVVMARDVEKWGQAEIPEDKQLMPDFAFPAMEKCDMLICEFSEKGVGLGIGAAYAFAKNKPVYIIAKKGSDISTTISNIATKVIFYEHESEITESFKDIVNEYPRIILASKSKERKQMLIDYGLQFEVIVSNCDETPNPSKDFRGILAEIALRKAKAVLKKTSNRGKRLIIAADQNIVFNGKMYGKPKSMEEAYNLVKSMQGSDEIYSYTGNAVLVADKSEILEMVNVTDIARMGMDVISDEELTEYFSKHSPLNRCGGFSILDAPFVHLKEGKRSTACGMTLEITDFLKNSLFM